MRKGFTLVELSIVLIIIGLLVTGVLAGRSMIGTSKVQMLIKQISQFDIAVADFKDVTKTLPGDASVFGCNSAGAIAGRGCDNGTIEDNLAYCCAFGTYTYEYDGEVSNFWMQLQQNGFKSNNGTLVALTGTTNFSTSSVNPTSPVMAINNAGVIPYYNGGVDPLAHYYLIADFSTLKSAFGVNGNVTETIPVMDALAIDSKLDDGTAAYIPTATAPAIVTGAYFNNTCAVGSAYNIGNSAAKCVLAIKMLSSSGLQ